jgi:manganese-transporting P-type ATPase
LEERSWKRSSDSESNLLLKANNIPQEGDERVPWFYFQKTKYVWDSNKKQFQGLEFPINRDFNSYMEWKGYKEDQDVLTAETKYGKNQ